MSQDWFRLSDKDGSLHRVKSPGEKIKPVRWIERDLENLLALNPDFLGFTDQMPLRLGGVRGTVTSPDQAFVDELGRVSIVEVKKISASLSVISQAMAYADHWRLLPPGAIDRNLQDFADECMRAEIFGRALFELQSWANGDSDPTAETNVLQSLGRRVLKRLAPNWAVRPVENMKLFAQAHWGRENLPFVGAPARIIAVAPKFHDECIEFAQQLTQRMVGIELVEVEIVKSDESIYVGREWAHREPVSEATWKLFRRAWDQRGIRDYFVLNGWADALNGQSFSLSACGVSDARFWLWASDSEACITTTVPGGWYKSDRDVRNILRQSFLDALPGVKDR